MTVLLEVLAAIGAVLLASVLASVAVWRIRATWRK